MDTPMGNLLVVLGVIGLTMLIAGLVLLWLAVRKLRALDLRPDTPLGESLQRVPFVLVLALDLLDMSLNFFSAPLVWVVLDRFGAKPLRNLATAVAAIPGTQFIPTLTLGWLIVRTLHRRRERGERRTLPPGRRPGPVDGEGATQGIASAEGGEVRG